MEISNDEGLELDSVSEVDPASEIDSEREALVEERKNRRTGKSNLAQPRYSVWLLGAVGLVALGTIAIGPTQAFKMMGIIEPEDTGQKASQVDLEVDRQENTNDFNLDFVVPTPEEVAKEDPNAKLKEEIETLKEQLEALINAPKEPEVSKQDIQNLLDRYDEKVAAQIEAQQEAIRAENEILKEELQRREEEELARAKAKENADKAQAELEATEEEQIISSMVIVDQASQDALSSSSGQSVVSDSYSDDLSKDQRFLASAKSAQFETSLSEELADPSKTVVQGTIISGVLETAINTELPGNIRAQVIEPVFSHDGTRILMPAGTSLIGTFNPDINIAQKRVLIAWNRAITPEGQSIAIGSTGADRLGRSGTGGRVDNRFWQKFGSAVLVSTISAIPNVIAGLGQNSESRGENAGGTTINIGGQRSNGGGLGQQALQGSADALADQSQGILEKYLSLPPVIHVPQGEEIRVFVNRDLVFK